MKMIMPNNPVRALAPRRVLIRRAAHSVNAAAPPDITISAVMIPNWKKNATIRIVYQFTASSAQTSPRIASPTVTAMVSGLKSAMSNPATRIPAPIDANTFFVTMLSARYPVASSELGMPGAVFELHYDEIVSVLEGEIMTKVWLVRNDTYSDELEDGGFISIGWDGTDNLDVISLKVEDLISDLAKLQPESSVGSQ